MTLSLLKCGNSSFSHYDCLSLSFKYCIHMDMQSSVRYDNIFTNTCPVSRRMHASVKVKVLNRKQPVKLDQKQYMLGTWNFNDFWWKINIIIHNSLYIHTYSSIICHDMKIDSLPLFSFFFFYVSNIISQPATFIHCSDTAKSSCWRAVQVHDCNNLWTKN